MSALGAETSDLFYSDFIARFVNAPGAVSRGWLHEEVRARLAQPDCRFVLLTGEPGAGKTGVMTGLAAANPDWLRYFIRADSIRPLSSVDSVSLLLRIGHQLAQKQPDLFRPELLEAVVVQKIENVGRGGTATGIRIEDLTVSPFRSTALRVEQNIGALAGNLIGIEIARANLEPRMLQPDVLAELALFGPAVALASQRPDQIIVVLIDGLDEAIASREVQTILDWLERFPEAPSNVKFVLSSRPHPRLRAFQSVRGGALQTITIESFSTQVRNDARAFAETLFSETGIFTNKPSSALGAAIDALTTAAKGNFAYLTAYSRSLRSAVQSGDSGMLEDLAKFEALPEGLLPLYAALVRRLRRQVDLLGRLPVAFSTSDEQLPAWDGVGQRILAILSVAFAPVALDQLAALGDIRAWKDDIRNVFENFVPLLDQSTAGWQFFHPSLGEFLRGDGDEDISDIVVDTPQWDARIVQHYRKGADWPDVSWHDVDEYGLLNIPRHLARGGGSRAVLPVLSRKLRLAMRDRFHTDLPFRRVVEEATPDPTAESDIGRVLADTMFLEMIFSGLDRHAAQLEPAVYGLLARVGRVDEALARANVQQPGMPKYRSLEAIVACTPATLRGPLGPLNGVEMLVTAALEVSPSSAGGLFVGMDRHRCLLDAACKMAEHDLDRALGLADSIDRGFDDDRDRIIAAGIKAMPLHAQELLARMTRGRAKVALDAAEHLPDGARALTAIALADLAQEEVAEQWRILARAFALAKGESRDIIDRLEREISETARKYPQRDDGDESDRGRSDAAPDDKEPSGWRRAATDVAEHIYPFAPDVAQRILALWEPALARFESADALVKAAKLWIAWGRPVDARRSLEKALAFYRGLGWYGPARDIAKTAAVADAMDRSWGQELADEAIGLLAPMVETASSFERGRLDSILEGTFDAFRRWDRARALKVARWMTRGWISGGEWNTGGRGSAIALLGLDAADDPGDACADLLKECMAGESEGTRFGRPELAVTDFGLFSHSKEQSTNAQDQLRVANFIGFITNQMNYWVRGREWRYFDDPAEVLRSMDYPFPAGASWARSLAAGVSPLARRDLDRAITVTSWLGDPAERMIALAALAAELRKRDHLHANAVFTALHAANENLPVYHPEIDLGVDAGREVLLYLNPSLRARFESAAYLLRIDSSVSFELVKNTCPYIQAVCHAQLLFEQLSAMTAEDDASRFDELTERVGKWDDLLGDLVKLESVAARRHRDAAEAREKAMHIGNETLRTRALLHCVAGADIAAQCVSILDGAKPESLVQHGGQLAAVGMRICAAAGKSSRPLVERGLEALANADMVSRAHGLPALADEMQDGGHSDLLAQAIRAADGAGNGYLQTDALVRIFSSAVAAKDGALVAQLASTLIRNGWRSIMDGLCRAMPRLIEAAGPAIVEDLDAAMRRAQAVFDTEPGQGGPPTHLDGVIAPHLRPADTQSALYQAPQLAPEFLASFLDRADISSSATRSRDSRDEGMEPNDVLFEQLHGRHAGFSLWVDAQDRTIGQLFDIRFYFDTVDGARDYLQQKLQFLSEGDPEIAGATRVGEDCFVSGGEFDRKLGEYVVRMVNYTYIFRVDRFVAKLYAAQGVFAAERLTPAHVFQLAKIANRRIGSMRE